MKNLILAALLLCAISVTAQTKATFSNGVLVLETTTTATKTALSFIVKGIKSREQSTLDFNGTVYICSYEGKTYSVKKGDVPLAIPTDVNGKVSEVRKIIKADILASL